MKKSVVMSKFMSSYPQIESPVQSCTSGTNARYASITEPWVIAHRKNIEIEIVWLKSSRTCGTLRVLE